MIQLPCNKLCFSLGSSVAEPADVLGAFQRLLAAVLEEEGNALGVITVHCIVER